MLCTRCHGRVHEGQLRIEGDADGELSFYDGSGQAFGQASTTPGGHTADLSSCAATLLRAMGTRGGWNADELCYETRLQASDISVGLFELELAGLVHRDAFFAYQASAR